MPYVALEDITVGVNEGDGTDDPSNISPIRSRTMGPGEIIGDDELSARDVERYKSGKISNLLQKVSSSQARELEKMLASGEDVSVKMIKDVIIARGEEAKAKRTTRSKGDDAESQDEAA